jgi:acyl-CoA dehydrogenase
VSEFTRELTDLIRSLAQDADHPADGQVTRHWQQVQDLGLVGIGIAEDAGGSGGEVADLLVAVRELARAGIATPLVEASTAAFAIGPAAPGAFDTVVINDDLHLSDPTPTIDVGIVPFTPLAGVQGEVRPSS